MPHSQKFTLAIFTEDQVGLLLRVTTIFSRRHVNIESITASESEVPGVHRYTIVVSTNRDMADKIAAQIEKQVEVLRALVYEEGQVINRDLALFKMGAGARQLPGFEQALARHGARIIGDEPDFLVVEKTGEVAEIAALLQVLSPYGILEYVRSGRVSLTRPMKPLGQLLEELEQARSSADALKAS